MVSVTIALLFEINMILLIGENTDICELVNKNPELKKLMDKDTFKEMYEDTPFLVNSML